MGWGAKKDNLLLNGVWTLIFLAVLFYAIHRFNERLKDNHARIFHEFAISNKFIFSSYAQTSSLAAYGPLPTEHVRVIDALSGNFAAHAFRLYTYSDTSHRAEGGGTRYFGVLEVQLANAYPALSPVRLRIIHLLPDLIATAQQLNGSAIEVMGDTI